MVRYRPAFSCTRTTVRELPARSAGSPGQLARPGIGLYGASMTEALGLEQTVNMRARIIDVRDVHVGESVSYGATWSAPGTRRIARWLRLRRRISTHVVEQRHRTRARSSSPGGGTVTMDMTMLDVTGVEGCDVGSGGHAHRS
jgi:alanine racemase